MENQKMITTAKNLDVVVKVMAGFTGAGAVVCGVFAVLVGIFGESMFQGGMTTLDLDFLKIHLVPDYQFSIRLMRIYVMAALMGLVPLFFGITKGLDYLRRILEPMKLGRPFETEVVIYLKKIAWLILILGAVTQVAGVICRVLLARAFDLEKILTSPAIAGMEYVISVDFGFVLVFALVMFLARIFEYGQNLQREADETL